MNKQKFITGEWCFFEFNLSQIKQTDEGRITEVSDGMMSHNGRDLSDRCFPLDMTIKRISDTTAYYSRQFHSLSNNALNHPDLHRELVRRWALACDSAYDTETSKRILEELAEWANEVQKAVNNLHDVYVGDVPLFRR